MRSPDQNFLSAKALGIQKKDRNALIEVMGEFERGEVENFDMASWGSCIYAQCRKKGAFYKATWTATMRPEMLYNVFCPWGYVYKGITQSMAAQAIRNFLVHNDPMWSQVSPPPKRKVHDPDALFASWLVTHPISATAPAVVSGELEEISA